MNASVSKVLSLSLVLNLLHKYAEQEYARSASTEVAGIVSSIDILFPNDILVSCLFSNRKFIFQYIG